MITEILKWCEAQEVRRQALIDQAVRNILSKVNGATKRWEPIFIAGLCSEGIRAEFRKLERESDYATICDMADIVLSKSRLEREHG